MNATLLALALALAPQAATPPPHAPRELVERLIPEASGVRRLTVFADGSAVLSAPTGSGRLLRRRTLERDELVALLGTVREALPGLERLAADSAGPAVLRLRRPGSGLLVLRYDPSRVPPLPLGRVLAALDDLEAQLREAPQVAEAVRGWAPRPGDRVELWGGGTAVVTEVREGGVVVLEHEGSPAIEALRVRDLPARVRRVLGR